MRTLTCHSILPVSGVSYRQDAVRAVNEGDRVRLVADPSNPHDERAIAVVSDEGRLLGYVPAALTDRLHATGGTAFDAVVHEVLEGDTWGLRLKYLGASDDTSTPPGHVERAAEERAGDDEAGDDEVVPAAIVRTRSKRVLGSFAGVEGKHTLVRVDGREVRYPSAVVEVVPA